MIHWRLPSPGPLGAPASRNRPHRLGKARLHAPSRRRARRPRAPGRCQPGARPGRGFGRGREDHQAQQEGGRRVREPELRPGAQDPQGRAGRLSRGPGSTSSQIAARTHVHLGVVLFAGFKQKDEALAEFKKALEIAPDVKLDKLLATPEIQEVFDQAVVGAEEPRGRRRDDRAGGRRHHPRAGDPGSAQGKAIPINMTLDSSVKAKKVVLSFSADGSEDFGEREMKEESPGNWMGEIPASATQGAKVSYYIEVDGDDDQVVAKKGSAAEPMVVELRGPGGARWGQEEGAAAAQEEGRVRRRDLVLRASRIGSGFGWTTGRGRSTRRRIDGTPDRAMGRRSPGDRVRPAASPGRSSARSRPRSATSSRPI